MEVEKGCNEQWWNTEKYQWKEDKKEAHIEKLDGSEWTSMWWWANGLAIDKRAENVQDYVEEVTGSYWSEELLQIYQYFSEDHLENKTESFM